MDDFGNSWEKTLLIRLRSGNNISLEGALSPFLFSVFYNLFVVLIFLV